MAMLVHQVGLPSVGFSQLVVNTVLMTLTRHEQYAPGGGALRRAGIQSTNPLETPTMSTLARSAVSLAASAVTAVTVGLAPGRALAVDFDGYFRAGPGATSKDAARACYNLGISGGHYRLGNECDFYGEFGLAQTGNVDGVAWKAKVMFNEYNPGTDVGKSSSSFEQMYVEGKGFDISPDTNFWIGKRFYGRADVHILDTNFVRMDGVGAGAD
jgi:maltoporin